MKLVFGIPWSRAALEMDSPSSTAFKAACIESSSQVLRLLGLFGLSRQAEAGAELDRFLAPKARLLRGTAATI